MFLSDGVDLTAVGASDHFAGSFHVNYFLLAFGTDNNAVERVILLSLTALFAEICGACGVYGLGG